MENKKLINEIIKINNLMGFNNNDHLTPDKLIISELVTIFKTLLQDAPQAFKVFDDAMLAIKNQGRKITAADIDDLVDGGLSKSLTKIEISELKSALKKHISTLNDESDFLAYLSKLPSNSENNIIKKIKNLTIADSDEFLKKALNKVVNNSVRLNETLQSFILSIPSHLNDIRINGWIINSVEDYESYLRSYLRNQLSGVEEPARTVFIDKAMLMIKENDKYKAAIKNLDGSGNISTKVTNYSPQSNINLSDILTPKPKSTTVIGRKRTSPVLDSNGNPTIIEETLPPEIVTRYENIKIKATDGDVLTGAEQKLLNTVDEWKEFKTTIDDVNKANDGIGSGITPLIDISSIADDMFDANNVLKGNWEDIFFGKFINKKFGWCQGELREYIVNRIRSFFRTTEQFKADYLNTLTRIKAITDEIGVKTDSDSIIRGDKLVTVKKALEELDVLTRRLKNSMLGAQRPEKMFESIWNEIKVSIRQSLDEANMPYTRQEEILARIKGSGDDLTSIENWIKKSKGDFDVSEMQKLKNTRQNILEAWKQIPDSTKLLRKLFTKIGIVISNIAKLYLRNAINFIMIGVGTLKKNFLRIAFSKGMISRSGVCKNYLYLNNGWAKLLHAYLVVQIWVRVMTPVYNLFGNLIGTGVESLVQGIQGLIDPKMTKFDIYDTKDGVGFDEQFVIDFMDIFNFYIYDKDGKLPPKLNMPKINPLLNPIPGTMNWEFLSTIGFEPAPAPKWTYDAFGKMYLLWRNQGAKDDKDVPIVVIAKEQLKQFEENRTTEQIAATQEFFNKAYDALGESKDWYGLNESESETLKKHMYPETDLIDSEIWVCGNIPTKTDRNIYMCSGNRKWRMVFYEDGKVSLPDGGSNIYYKDNRYGKCYYVSNKAEENNPKPNSGTSDENGNFENLKPIKGLIKDLI